MQVKGKTSWAAVAVSVLVVLGGCGSGSSETAATTTTTSPPFVLPEEPDLVWATQESVDPLDDSESFSAHIDASHYQGDTRGIPSLWARCQQFYDERKLDVWVDMNIGLRSDIDDEVFVEYRIDDDEAQSDSLGVSTDNEAFFFRDGATFLDGAREFLDTLLGTERLLVRTRDVFGGELLAEFDLAGIEAATAVLRESCEAGDDSPTQESGVPPEESVTRPGGFLAGALFDLFTSPDAGASPGNAVCMTTALLGRFTEDQLLNDMQILTFSDEAFEPVAEAARECGIQESTISSALAIAQGD